MEGVVSSLALQSQDAGNVGVQLGIVEDDAPALPQHWVNVSVSSVSPAVC